MSNRENALNPNLLLRGYTCGLFPMAEDREDDRLFWVDPDERGILPLDGFHIPKSLRKQLRAEPYNVTVDTDFEGVIRGCAAPGRDRESTWINRPIENLYIELFTSGFAHSVECWHEDQLVGGLYGVKIGSAFFGESMFHRATGASKIALVYLVARLIEGGFMLLDTQFVTDHLKQFGVIEIPRREYLDRLERALEFQGDWSALPVNASPDCVLQAITQTS